MDVTPKQNHSNLKIKQIFLFMTLALVFPLTVFILQQIFGIHISLVSFFLTFEGSLAYFTVVMLAMVLMLIQIMNEKSRQAAVQSTELRFKALVENSYDAITLIDQAGTILYTSPSTQKVIGYTSAELMGKNIFSLIYPDDLPFIQQKMSELTQKTGSMVSAEFRGLNKDGTWHWIEGVATNLLEEPYVKAIVVNYRDITSRKMADLMKKDFISLVSHQLKTPVAQLKGFIENMLEGITGELNEKQRNYLSQMLEIVIRNYKLITNLLNISRIERGVITIEKHPWKLKEIIDQMKLNYDEAVTKRGLQFNIDTVDETIEIFADREKLEEAIGNLIMNAVKFTEKGAIGIRTGIQNDFVLIEVSDTGQGISEDVLKKLFNPDMVLSGSASVEKGAGLGLYIAKQFLLLQGGDIAVKSVVGKGSIFTIAIPKNVYNLNKDYVRNP